jgi:hypothetical protein
MSFEDVKRIAETMGGKINEVGVLPDGSGFATMSYPLPKDHWSLVNPEAYNVPAMPFRMGEKEFVTMGFFPAQRYVVKMTRKEFADKIREAGKYAYRCATMNGKEPDLDPDALLQNLIVGLLGYWSEDGLSEDDFANPVDVK